MPSPIYLLLRRPRERPSRRTQDGSAGRVQSIFRRRGCRFGVENATKPINLERVPIQSNRSTLSRSVSRRQQSPAHFLDGAAVGQHHGVGGGGAGAVIGL